MIVHGHGWWGGGDAIRSLNLTISYLAASGYIVVAPMSASGSSGWDFSSGAYANWCIPSTMADDMTRVVDWIEASDIYKPMVDWSKPKGIIGYSMGGAAAKYLSTDEAAKSKYNFGAAVAMHPVNNDASLVPSEDSGAAVMPLFLT